MSPSASELALRIAQAHEMLMSVPCDEDGEPPTDYPYSGLFSALDYALRGSEGCVEPAEFEAERRAALDRHREYLGL